VFLEAYKNYHKYTQEQRTKPRTIEDADEIMRKVVESIINDFDKNYSLTG